MMDVLEITRRACCPRNRQCLALILGMMGGFLFGILPTGNSPETALLMRRAFDVPVSIVLTFAVLSVPLIFSAFAVLIRASWLFPVVAFCKAAGFSCFGTCLQRQFGDAGWLVRSLFLFSSMWNLPVLFFFWFRHAGNREEGLWADLGGCMLAELAIAAIDAWVMAPLLSRIVF